MRHILATVLLVIVSFASARGITCHEGVNASIAGVPFYYWTTRECGEKSRCFTQELETEVFETNLEVTVQYGGCISTSYSDLVTCEALFGPESTLDPAVLFNMIPDLDKTFQSIGTSFAQNLTKSLTLLLSDGQSSESFIEGLYRFLEKLGFNMEKAIPLKPHLIKGLKVLTLVPESYEEYVVISKNRTVAAEDLLNAIGDLDTLDSTISENIYTFLGNFMRSEDLLRLRSSYHAPLIDQLPGLVKSMIPASWGVSDMYDVTFELLGDLRFSSPKKTAVDVINTMKSAMTIPAEYKKYLDPILDTAPQLVEQMTKGNFTYASTWSVQLLKAESLVNPVTTRLSNSILKFLSGLYPELPSDIHTLIIWFPGLLYEMFPSIKAELDTAYNTLAEGFESIDWQNPTSTLPTTRLSDFVIFITDKLFMQGPDQRVKGLKDLLIINFSKTLYNLMPDYSEQIDTISTTLSEGFSNFPNFDVGKITENIITNLGMEVPGELKPLLDHMQGLLGAYNLTNFDPFVFRSEATKVINAYKKAYPESEFPDLFKRQLDYYYRLLTETPSYAGCDVYLTEWNTTAWELCFNEYNKKMQKFNLENMKISAHLSVDTSFATFRALEVNSDPLYKMLLDSFPEFRLYIRLMRAIGADDVKDLYDDFARWIIQTSRSGKMLTVEGFVNAVNGTIFKITSKLGDVTKELRNLFSPDSCKYAACDKDLCNSHEEMMSVTPVTRDPLVRRILPMSTAKSPIGDQEKKAATATPVTTTSGAEQVSFTTMLNVATLWLASKVMLG